MKKFRFQSVLEYRKNIEEEIQQEHLVIRKKLSKEEKKLFTIRDQIVDFHQKLHEKQMKNICPAEIELHQKFLHALARQEKRQNKKIQDLELSLENKRQELLQATREKKIMEKLKEKAEASQRKDLLLEEQKILDEKACHQGHILEDR